ncbi:MAG: multidrug efflux RND transporter permease subunit [Pseudomonadota bacterium]
MKLPHFFIERPIFAAVLSILIVIVGAISYTYLPVSQYPEIAPPTIQVNATYPGASAEEVMKTVATPLEQEINGVENMIYMHSQATGDGQVSIRVTFALGTDLDTAQVQVQNRVSIAEARLPEEVRRIGVTTRKNTPDLLMVVHLYAPDKTFDQTYIANYAILQIKDKLARIQGVGDIRVYGASEYAMRIWVNPNAAAAHGVSASDIIRALRTQNIQVASGAINREPIANPGAYEITIRTKGRLVTPKEFGEVVIKSTRDNRVTRLRDVARIELGSQDYLTKSYLDTNPAVALVFYQRPGTNALETAATIKKDMQQLAQSFPPGLKYQIVYNPTEFIKKSINEVIKTIFEAVALVVLVIFIFLQSWRAAVIPIVAIPISLIGTFAIMAALGFSLNNLSLFGLVLAIGIVVDDAIVVVENVSRNLDAGLNPRDATHKTMDEVSGALIAMALVLVAVFMPTAFISGISGQFYKQFGLTIATATVISGFVSLTLSPALCRLLLQPPDLTQAQFFLWRWKNNFFRKFNSGLSSLTKNYGWLVSKLVRIIGLMLIVYLVLISFTAWRFTTTPTGFIPAQDQGYFIVSIQLPPGSALSRTNLVVQQVAEKIRGIPGVKHTVAFAGFSGATFTNEPNSAAIFVTLDDFDVREKNNINYYKVLNQLRGSLIQVDDALVFVIQPPSVRGIGTGGGFKMMVQDRGNRGLKALEESANNLVYQANQIPGLVNVFTLFNTNTPQYYLDIDRVKAEKLNVPISEIFTTLELYLGSVFINEFNYLGRTYRVTAQADSPHRKDLDDVLRLRMRNAVGNMVPIGSVATLEQISGPYRIPRFNLYPAVAITGDTLPGFSSGQALKAMEQLAAKVLPEGFSYEWTELAYQEKKAGSTAIIFFALAVVFVFLLLAAQYESWSLPLAIILIVPMCLLSALIGIQLFGIDNNILVQIGFVVLIGLASKNAILIVEFAKQQEDKGKTPKAAAVTAARLRLRPILMTSFAFILGVVPLVLATGAGAEMRQALGSAVFSGMIGVTIFGLFFTPVFYVVCRFRSKKKLRDRQEIFVEE